MKPATDLADEPELMTAEEVAVHLRCSPGYVRSLWRDGQLPGRKIGRQQVISREQLIAWIRQGDTL